MLSIYKNHMFNNLGIKEANLKERTEKVWNEIYDGIYDFNFTNNCKEFLESVTKEDLINFYYQIFERSVNRLSILYADHEKPAARKDIDTRAITKNRLSELFTSPSLPKTL